MAAVYKVGKKWRADFIDKEGIRHRKRFKTKGQADDYLTEIGSQLKEDTYVAPGKIPTFGQLADEWITGRIELSRTPGAGYRPSSLAQWQSHVEHMKFSFGAREATEIDVVVIGQAIGKWRLPKDKGGRELSARTVAKVLTTMSRIFRYGIANRKRTGVTTDYTKVLEKVKDNSGEQTEAGEQLNTGLHEVTEKEVLTPEEAKRVILAAKPGLYRAVIQTAIYTGARVSELLALRWPEVKLDRSVIEIHRTLSTAKVKGEASQEKVRWFDPKTKKGERDIPIPPQLVAALKEWKEKCPQSRLDLVFSNEFGEPCDRTGIGRYGLTPALKQAGINKAVSMHGLRHTYASMLIALGRKIPEVSQYLGHADVSITMRVYAHFLKPKKQDTMGDLERLIESSLAQLGTV
jgi:integrase